MKRTGRKKEWAVLVFCMFLLGISPPVILIFDKPDLIFNFPLSFLYLFGFWAIVIVFIALGARKRDHMPQPHIQAGTSMNRGSAKSRFRKSDAQ